MAMHRGAATACFAGNVPSATATLQQLHNVVSAVTVYCSDRNWQKIHTCCNAGCCAMCSLCGMWCVHWLHSSACACSGAWKWKDERRSIGRNTANNIQDAIYFFFFSLSMVAKLHKKNYILCQFSYNKSIFVEKERYNKRKFKQSKTKHLLIH